MRPKATNGVQGLDQTYVRAGEANMLAEQESTATLKMLEQIFQHLGIAFRGEEEHALAKATDVSELAKSLDGKLTAGS